VAQPSTLSGTGHPIHAPWRTGSRSQHPGDRPRDAGLQRR
jgi:hypothetical protein